MLGNANAGAYKTANRIILTTTNEMNALSEFGFGITYSNASAQYEDLLNSNTVIYGLYTNSSYLSLDIRGIALPSALYVKFANLLGIASQGQAACGRGVGSVCLLPKACNNAAYS